MTVCVVCGCARECVCVWMDGWIGFDQETLRISGGRNAGHVLHLGVVVVSCVVRSSTGSS
jgi:hypothetical protein